MSIDEIKYGERLPWPESSRAFRVAVWVVLSAILPVGLPLLVVFG